MSTWRVLEVTSVLIPSPYEPRYSVPADYSKGIQISLFSSGTSGNLQAGSPSSLTLSATETNASPEGWLVFLLTGNAKGTFSRITSYDNATKVAGVSPAFTIAPTVGDTYLIPSEELPIPYTFSSYMRYHDSIGKPDRAYIYADELHLSPVIDNRPAAIMFHYQLKPYKVDLTDTRLSNLYWDWREVLILGCMREYIFGTDDDRYKEIDANYKGALTELKAEEQRRKTF